MNIVINVTSGSADPDITAKVRAAIQQSLQERATAHLRGNERRYTSDQSIALMSAKREETRL